MMRFRHWLAHEIKSILTAMLFFLTCFAVTVVLKDLMLEQYDITAGVSASVLMLSLVTAKVVVLFERVSFGRQTGYVEHGLSERKDAGGFFTAIAKAFQHPDMPIILATLICVTLAFVVWTTFAVLRRAIGRDRLVAAFMDPPAPLAEGPARQ
jgi:uncharacterized protein involved in response to NO